MKKKLINFYKLFLCSILVLGAISCQTEELSDVTTLSSEAELAAKAPSYIWGDCAATYETTTLFAGQDIPVGDVSVVVVNGGNDYEITYTITDDDYCLTETHLSVVSDRGDFPMTKSGNPIPGKFEYSNSHDCESSFTYTVPVPDGDNTYVAAHAVVQCKPIAITVEEFDATLPETIDFCLKTGRNIEDARSYFRLDIAEGSLAGSYWAWCADELKSIDASDEENCYTGFNVFSLNDDLTGIISETDNIDNALWLINNSEEILNSGNYLYGHIQWALWKLLNDQECNSCAANLKLTGDYLEDAMAIYDRAMDEGEEYMAECEDYTMVIFDNGTFQPVIIPVLIPCDEPGCEETAWGAGCDFPGNNWFTYFEYGTD